MGGGGLTPSPKDLQAQASWLVQQRSLLLIQLILIKHLLCTRQDARCCGGGGERWMADEGIARSLCLKRGSKVRG